MLWNKCFRSRFWRETRLRQWLTILSAGMLVWCTLQCACCAEELEQGFVTTTPVLLDGVLYVASSSAPDRRGHLRAINVLDTIAVMLWDAADKVPLAGSDAAQPDSIALENTTRILLTDIDGELQPLDAASAAALQNLLDVDSLVEAETLLHALRGRRGGGLSDPAGTWEDPLRLWSFTHSSPVVVEKSHVSSEMASRDRILYIGADDGLLHAFFVSSMNRESEQYLVDDHDGGTELWGYLPGYFLPHLKNQPLLEIGGDLAISLDGTPQVREVFVDLDGNGVRSWHLLLAASGTILETRRSGLFVLDVTDPYQPKFLWEQPLPGAGTGRTRGVRLRRCDVSGAGCLYLSADAHDTEVNGLHVLAMELEHGELLWQFHTPYDEQGQVAEATPAVPVLADLDGNKTEESLILGDLLGRLWVIDADSGEALGGAPVFTTPGGLAEPIGTEVAVRKNTVVFASGGVGAVAPEREYKLYAVEILPEGARLRWSYSLLPGEKIWGAPRFDSLGNLVLATARNFRFPGYSGEDSTSGRVVVLNKDGEEITSRETDAATVGQVVTAPGVVLSVDLTGEVSEFGTPAQLTGPTENRGALKVLSWRQR